jgi:chromosomal replication initiation ATPase DnaA
MAMYIIRNKLPLKLKAIAELFGRDHTTAIHGIKNIGNEVRYNEDVRQDLENLINIL